MILLAFLVGSLAGLTLGAELSRHFGRAPQDVVTVGLFGMVLGAGALAILVMRGA